MLAIVALNFLSLMGNCFSGSCISASLFGLRDEPEYMVTKAPQRF
jgi:hypothetical protein